MQHWSSIGGAIRHALEERGETDSNGNPIKGFGYELTPEEVEKRRAEKLDKFKQRIKTQSSEEKR